jgi:hypothetical protein
MIWRRQGRHIRNGSGSESSGEPYRLIGLNLKQGTLLSPNFPALIPSSLLWTATRDRAATDLYGRAATDFTTPIYESASHVALTFRSAANKLSSTYPQKHIYTYI